VSSWKPGSHSRSSASGGYGADHPSLIHERYFVVAWESIEVIASRKTVNFQQKIQ
jgi:hypothetical protein